MRIGFVGLGSMGQPMAQQLLAKGFAVRGYDPRSEAVAALVQAGGEGAASAADAAAGADMLVLMVVNMAQAKSVLFEAGALAVLAPSGTVILCATCAPSAVEELASRVAGQGRRFVDAPVSGGPTGARSGTLTIMAAAPSDVFSHAEPVLRAMGEKLFHVGETPGQGAAVKTVNQLLCGVHIAAAAEALALAQKAGVDPGLCLKILGGSAAASWMLNNRGPRMLEAEPEVVSAVDIFVKDLGLVLDTGRASKAALPLAAAAHQLFLAASANGLGAKDDSQVVQLYRQLAGLD
jgi:3-hydroxyisobutyrate dehydrogenase